MQPRILKPLDAPAWTEPWNRNIEKAVGDGDAALDTRVSTIEDEIMALTDSAAAIVTAVESIERLNVTIAAAAQAQIFVLARMEALMRGMPDPLPSEEGPALITQFLAD